MKKRTFSALFSLLICLTVLLTSCGQTAKKADRQKFEIDESKFNVINAEGKSEFTIVRSDLASEEDTSTSIKLRNAILEKTSVELKLKTDFEKAGTEFVRGDYEILIGDTTRDESKEALNMISRIDDYAILQKGTRIAIVGGSGSALSRAVDYFIDTYIDDRKNSVSMNVGESYSYLHKYPVTEFKIGGNEIDRYSIYYNTDDSERILENAQTVRRAIEVLYGKTIMLVPARSNPKSGCNIIIGNLTKEEAVKNSIFAEDEYGYQLDGTNLVISSGFLSSLDDAVGLFLSEAIHYDKNGEKYTGTANAIDLSEDGIYAKKNTDGKKTIADGEYLRTLDEKQEKMIQNVLSSESDCTPGENGRIFYVSNSGDDSNDGRSPETAWRTLEKVNHAVAVLSGDVVLFERGGLWRGQLSAKGGVTYSAYGEGEKPKLYGSAKNYASAELWNKTSVPNVYKLRENLKNVGIIAFDHSEDLRKYDEVVGTNKIKGVDGFESENDLKNDLEFYSNLQTDELYLYSKDGNPGQRFRSIEIGARADIIEPKGDGITIDNLCLKYGGAHGVGSGSCKNLTVRNSVFCWIGGSILTGFSGGDITGYGNAVEIYGSCNGYTVENNYIYQIYDTGITHQYSKNSTTDCTMQNIKYKDNLIMYCHWSIEFYNQPLEGTTRWVKDVNITENFCRFGGYGWGSIVRNRSGSATLFNSFTLCDDVENFVSTNNVFDRSAGYLVRLNEGGDRKIKLDGNTYIQDFKGGFGYIYGKYYKFDENAEDTMKNTFNDVNAKLVYIMK